MLIDGFRLSGNINEIKSLWEEKLKTIFLLKPIKIENIIDIRTKIEKLMEDKGLKFNGIRHDHKLFRKYKSDLFLINTYSLHNKSLSPRLSLWEAIEYILVLAEIQNPKLDYKLDKDSNDEYFIDIQEFAS